MILPAFGAGSACCASACCAEPRCAKACCAKPAGTADITAMTPPKASRLPNRRFVMSNTSVSGC